MIDIKQSLAHTTWNCKYHIVFAPKYRRKVFYKEKRREVGKILRTLCEWKKVKILEAEVCPDHVHMLLEIPPKVSVSSFMGYLKGKSSLMIYEMILSRLVDTFISRISLTMLPVPKPHNTACVLSWEEARRWQSRSSGYSSS